MHLHQLICLCEPAQSGSTIGSSITHQLAHPFLLVVAAAGIACQRFCHIWSEMCRNLTPLQQMQQQRPLMHKASMHHPCMHACRHALHADRIMHARPDTYVVCSLSEHLQVMESIVSAD